MKRFLTFLLVLILTIPVLTFNSSAQFMGDLNGDNMVNSTDALVVLKFAVGIVTRLNSYTAADMDGNGKINSADALRILNVSVGKLATSQFVADPDEKYYAGKKYLIFGDSYSNTDAERGRVYSPWVNEFEKKLKPSTVFNMAYSGTSWGFSYYTNNNHVPYGCDIVLEATHDKLINPDVIIFFYGANDYCRWYDEDINQYFNCSDAELNELKYTTHTIASMRYCIETAKKAYPKAKLFLCTPIPINTTDIYLFSHDSTVQKREKQLEVAKRLGIEVIDTFSCGINCKDAEKYIDPRNNHPNEAGSKVIGNYIAAYIKNYFIKNK